MREQAELILGLTWADVPRAVRTKIALLLRDFVAVSEDVPIAVDFR